MLYEKGVTVLISSMYSDRLMNKSCQKELFTLSVSDRGMMIKVS